ncbi:MAG: hypothetical protein MK085_01220 [Phycisphaerales bacterium]|nr:hypothetical protein [Phycisphaerales bacterium]
MHQTGRQLLLLGILVVASLGAVRSGVAPDLTSQEKALLKYFEGKLSAEPVRTGSKIDRNALGKAWMTPASAEYFEAYGPNKGKTFTRTVKATGKYPEKWPYPEAGAVTVTIPGEYVFYDAMTPDRGVVTRTELDMGASVHVVYEPGEVVLPIGKNTSVYTTRLKVYDLHDPGAVKHSGKLEVTSMDRGDWKVTTPAGIFTCAMFTVTYDGSVGPANVKDTAIMFVHPEHGCVAKVTRNKVSAFLVYNSDDRMAFVLTKKP